jgi:hypothetical protein
MQIVVKLKRHFDLALHRYFKMPTCRFKMLLLVGRCYYLVLVTYSHIRIIVFRLAHTGSVGACVMSYTMSSRPMRADV